MIRKNDIERLAGKGSLWQKTKRKVTHKICVPYNGFKRQKLEMARDSVILLLSAQFLLERSSVRHLPIHRDAIREAWAIMNFSSKNALLGYVLSKGNGCGI